jgi:short-subunit dehydrogenase
MLDLNITALTHLTHLLVNRMIVQGRAAILNVSSVAGFFPLPNMSVYSATKAFVTSFSESLAMELRPHGITVTAWARTDWSAADHMAWSNPPGPTSVRTSADSISRPSVITRGTGRHSRDPCSA